MDHIQPQKEERECKVVSSIKVVEEDYEIQRPIFKDVEIERAKFVEKQVEVPVGFEVFAKEVGQVIANLAMDHIISKLEKKLDDAIKGRLDTITAPKIVEELKIVHKDVEVERPVFKDVQVDRAIVKDVEIKNAVIKDVPVTNAVVTNVPVINAVIQDKSVINPIFNDIMIDRPVYKDKEIVVIHPKYIDLQGRELKE